MQMPFSKADFLRVFAEYNLAIWPLQIVAFVLGAAVIVLLMWRPRWAGKAVAAVLSVFWMLMAIGYHWLFFAKINPAAKFFGALFLLQGFILLVEGTFRGRMRLAIASRLRLALSTVLIVYAFAVYPLLGLLVTHPYPETPLFGVVPCPTTIFTFGVLLLMDHPRPWLLAAIPLFWALVGGSAALLLNIPQDWGLLAALLAWLVARFTPPEAMGGVRVDRDLKR